MSVSTPVPVSRPPVDPRNVITEDAFRIDPALLGTPLARPWRRAAAMAIDGVLVATLANAPGFLFALAAALVLLRASAKRSSQQGYLRRSLRWSLRFGGALMLFIVAIATLDKLGDFGRSWFGDDEPAAADAGGDSRSGVISGVAGLTVAADAIALTRSTSEADARRRVERMVRAMRDQGVPDREIREMLTGLQSTPGKPWIAVVTDSIMRDLAGDGGEVNGDSLALRLAAALSAGDSAGAVPLRGSLALALAEDTLRELSAELSALRARERSLEADLREEQRRFGLIPMLSSIADDLGLGFGWTGLYFTAFLTLWKGYTPGKRLLRIRVIRLDGKPLGWWSSFERFGGYAASLATGLLGFFQILWDRNRQGIHDKIAETVVVRA